MTEEMDIQDVMRYLPHGYPFLLVDRVLSYDRGQQIRALKNVTINEPFFQGHFPHYPVMPGVLILEAMAQTAAILGFRDNDTTADDGNAYLFAGVDKARFRAPVRPGDQLILTVGIKRAVRGIWQFEATAEVDEKVVASADLMCTLKALG